MSKQQLNKQNKSMDVNETRIIRKYYIYTSDLYRFSATIVFNKINLFIKRTFRQKENHRKK